MGTGFRETKLSFPPGSRFLAWVVVGYSRLLPSLVLGQSSLLVLWPSCSRSPATIPWPGPVGSEQDAVSAEQQHVCPKPATGRLPLESRAQSLERWRQGLWKQRGLSLGVCFQGWFYDLWSFWLSVYFYAAPLAPLGYGHCSLHTCPPDLSRHHETCREAGTDSRCRKKGGSSRPLKNNPTLWVSSGWGMSPQRLSHTPRTARAERNDPKEKGNYPAAGPGWGSTARC